MSFQLVDRLPNFRGRATTGLAGNGKRSAQTVRDGSPKGRDAGSVHNSPSAKGHGQKPGRMNWTLKANLRGDSDGNDG